MVARDISLSELTGANLHIPHVSTSGTVAMVREAKRRGLRVTAEVCPHHLTITDRWAIGGKGEDVGPPELAYDTSTKVYPPLRGDNDVEALLEGLSDGTIDCIATDHAPHDFTSKMVTYQEAAFGISVLETALGSILSLVHRRVIDLPTMVERLTVGPARVLGEKFADYATMCPGTPADITLFDPEREWVVDVEQFASKGKNTPLHGTTLKGKVVATIVAGKLAYYSFNLGVSG
jgi:dihydroorotase